jgi:hypothetical protein
MESILFLSILFISITLIYLVVYKKTIQIKIENFENAQIVNSINTKLIESIAEQLQISPNRIKNYKENGNIEDINNYSIEFEINPRNIIQVSSNELSLKDLQEKLIKMTEIDETFQLKSLTGKDIFLSKIIINDIKNEDINIINENNKKKDDLKKKKDKFVNPQLEKSVKYLKGIENGFLDDYDLDPRYNFKKGQLVLKPIPTPDQTPTPTP